MEIGTYISKSVTSELSGNVIDLCPVGALTAKPSRYKLRPWELIQQPSVAVHDGIGSNLFIHTRNGRVMRVVPRENEAVNETWISDRERFSYVGLYASDRLKKPMLRDGEQWREVEWEEALEAAATQLRRVRQQHGDASLGALVSPNASLEELYLSQKLLRQLGSNNIDHRLRQIDFSGDEQAPVMPWLGLDIAAIPTLNAALIVGCEVRQEAPLFGHRLRVAAIENGAALYFVHSHQQNLTFDAAEQMANGVDGIVTDLAAVLKAGDVEVDSSLSEVVASVEVTDSHRATFNALKQAEHAAIVLGQIAQMHPQYFLLQALASAIADATGASFGYLTQGGNSAGAWLAGAVPHRQAGGQPVTAGMNAGDMLKNPPAGLLLLGVEPELDSAAGQDALNTLSKAESVVVLTPFVTDAMKKYATVLLPVGTHVETAGTWVNAEGRWQSVKGVASPVGESRPAWKVLRVLGNLMDVDGFDFLSVEEVRAEVQQACQDIILNNVVRAKTPFSAPVAREGLVRVAPVAMYSGDSIQRRAEPLQSTEIAQSARRVHVSPADAAGYTLSDGDYVHLTQDGYQSITLEVVVDEAIPTGTVLVASGIEETMTLPGRVGEVELRKVSA
ncbi:MAG TPA: NADH-quinone oxidoreductase subunit G, partial [Halothiobacillus sp.]|nr:NADH-quinone oxidoreductase subunit G [Halothiobacillus sp.]